MVEKKVESTVFERELGNILDRVRSYGTLFDERIEKVNSSVAHIQQIVVSQGANAAFGEQKILVSELVSLLKEGEPTFRSIRDSVLQMKQELRRGKNLEEHEVFASGEVEEL